MKNFIVTKITGKAYIEDSSGHLKELHTGDSVPEGAIIHTSADGSAESEEHDQSDDRR